MNFVKWLRTRFTMYGGLIGNVLVVSLIGGAAGGLMIKIMEWFFEGRG